VKDAHIPEIHNPALAKSTIAKLRAQSLYPLTEPPAFGQFGGNVPANYALTMTAPAGTIYYTLNGADPRTAYTGAIAGTQYTGPVTLTQTGTVKARARSGGGEWSALTETVFIVGTAASSASLAVSELNYHPLLTEDHEFIELVNTSAGTIDLTGVSFTAGITFTFPQGTLLAAGARILVVRNVAAFNAQYGAGLPVAGAYVGGLDNDGEEIALAAANGADIFRFVYDDAAPWPVAADTAGRSLVLRSPGADPTNAANWRSSAAAGGNPGVSDRVAFTGSPLADLDFDGIPALLEHILGTSDNDPETGIMPVPAIEMFDIGAGPQPFLTFTAAVELAADDVALAAELSTNLSAWDATPAAIVFLGETGTVGGTATLKWRAAAPMTPGAPRQFIRLRATLAP
jgi:Lamin Tail Domain/Chitobiase/beta-hexosaminidase C-terminal domain